MESTFVKHFMFSISGNIDISLLMYSISELGKFFLRLLLMVFLENKHSLFSDSMIFNISKDEKLSLDKSEKL